MSTVEQLSGKVAVVTGAGRGIGQAIAGALADAGATVVVVSRTLSEVEETVGGLRAKGQRALAIAADVADHQAVDALVARTVEHFGAVHILVNNAGVQGPIGALAEVDAGDWARTIQINLVGTFHCCQAVLPHMIKQRSGKIISLSGGGATAPRPFFSAYAASKAAVVRLMENLAEEVREYNIQVNAIAPGAVNTRMLGEVLAAGSVVGERALAEAHRQSESGGTPPGLAASLVVFLASHESDGLTGKLIAAPHDGWQSWNGERIAELMSAPWLTLRRMDPFTLHPLIAKLRHDE